MAGVSGWTIRQRLIAAFASLTIVTLCVGGVGYYSAQTGATSIEDVGVNRLPGVSALLQIMDSQCTVDGAEKALLSTRLTPQMRADFYQRFDKARAEFEASWKVYERLPKAPEEATFWKEFVPAWASWWKGHETFVELARAYEKAQTDAAYQAMADQGLVANGASYDKANGLLDRMVELNNSLGTTETTRAMSTASSVKVTVLLTMMLAALVATGLGFVITTSLNRVLSARVEELRQGSEQVTAAAGQVSSAAQGLSQGATEQAASLEETSASMEEMAAMTRRNAESAGEAARLMAQVDQQVTSSNRDLGGMVDAMAAIRDSSSKISKIIKTIDEIAFQTNILALNAAVEAARAGEAGMGFAVVADEVRNLAQRAASAAKDTAGLIEEAGRNAQMGNDRVMKVRDSISGLTADIGRVKSIAAEVSTASQQQTQGIDQVTQAISQMEKVTQTTAATAEESAAASEELSAQAETSMGIVHQIEELVHGTRGAGVTASPLRRLKVVTPAASARVPPRRQAAVVPIRAEQADNGQANGTFGKF